MFPNYQGELTGSREHIKPVQEHNGERLKKADSTQHGNVAHKGQRWVSK